MYAEVVVNDQLSRLTTVDDEPAEWERPLGRTFDYDVPAQLEGVLSPGHLVWVDFGERRLYGIVFGLSPSARVQETRPLVSLVLDEPVLTSAQLALARWMSSYYLAPLLDCLRLMLPPGLLRSAEPVLEALTSRPYPPELSAPQRELLDSLQEGSVSLRRLKRRIPHLLSRSVVDPLVQQSLVARRQRVVKPPLQPKTGRRVLLLADADEVASALPRLGHASKQADVLRWLAESEDPLPSLSAVLSGADCSDGPVRSLAERGWVGITSRRRLLVPILSAEQAQSVLNVELSGAPSQAQALRSLQDAGGPVEESLFRGQNGVSLGLLKALEGRGYLRRVEDEPKVLLRLDPEEAADRIIELRGAEKHRAVLDSLLDLFEEASDGEPVSEWIGWVYAETGCSLNTLRDLEKLGLITIEEEEIWRDPLAGREFVTDVPPIFTADQAAVWEVIKEGISSWLEPEKRVQDGPPIRNSASESSHHRLHSSSSPPAYLLHGVTGSGKTEIYLRAIARTLSAGRQAIVLVPEISLTPQTIRRFAARFPGRVGVVHSQLARGERYDTWRRIRSGRIDIVIGPRSALFQPLPRLGLIIVDEEHDDSYKQDDLLSRSLVRYHACEATRQLGHISGSPLIMGSATPSLESYHAARTGALRLLELPQRILGHVRWLEEQRTRVRAQDVAYHSLPSGAEVRYADLPQVEVVDLRHELRVGNRGMFSRALQEGLNRTLAEHQQAILFLNRRGAATFVMCRDCGHVLRCPRCEVSFTYHLQEPEFPDGGPLATLVCHHCNRREPVPPRCPACDSLRIRHFGVGTQRVEVEVQRLFPQARTLRWDWDVTRYKGAHEVILSQFAAHQADVLIGTQMIAKGLDLPLVTLVGVITADTALHLPDYRAGERTFQLLTQVAGRAGRSILGGRVIVQTYTPEHYAIRAAASHDYEGFFDKEMGYRRLLGYPPLTRLARIVAVDEDALRCREAAEEAADLVRDRIAGQASEASVVGPAPCFFATHRGRTRWQVIVRSEDPITPLRGLPLPANCWIDVDPVSLL